MATAAVRTDELPTYPEYHHEPNSLVTPLDGTFRGQPQATAREASENMLSESMQMLHDLGEGEEGEQRVLNEIKDRLAGVAFEF